jgi:CUG-BP- and ETR3-like factor
MAGPIPSKPDAVCSEPKVFVGQVPIECTQEQVFQLFSKYGTVKKCALITAPDGRSKGCAMVTYDRWAEAETAIEQENNTTNLGGGRTLLVKFADPPRGRGDGPVTGVAPKKLFIGQVTPTASVTCLVPSSFSTSSVAEGSLVSGDRLSRPPAAPAD